ncbi:MAG: Gfo/Idh/MocA family oxidoreductase [Actinomycetia bacterium]|nr:Gfo/Idh/MocA family oxidoreductase [Actinomycetes bacterium]
MQEIINIGVIGCGNISGQYMTAMKTFPMVKITGCADLDMKIAEKKAEEYDFTAMSIDDLLNDRTIDIILNLTIPKAHTEVNLMALQSGKHVHCEKPLATSRKEGAKVLKLAREKGLLVGCAPDTFLGGGLQTCRKIIDDGWIGKPVAGTAFMMCHGHESWHPNPGFYYLSGGGPLYDMGPYYITALINLLGPVKRVSAVSAMTFKERLATSKEQYGNILPVEVPTHITGILEFCNGAVITMVMSFDVWHHSNHNIEIHGELGSLQVPDPNTFWGPVKINQRGEDSWQTVPLSHGYTDKMRGIGVADMACAIKEKRVNRCSGELGYHVLDVMEAIGESSEQGRYIDTRSAVERPKPLVLGLRDGEIA